MKLANDSTNIGLREQTAREKLADWLDAAGLPSDDPAIWPLTREDAARVLNEGAGYDVSEEDLYALGKLNQVPDLSQWDAKDLIGAGLVLSARRQWRFGCRDWEKSPQQLAYERAAAAGQLGELRSQLLVDLPSVLSLIVESDSRVQREALYPVLRTILEADYGVKL